MDVVYLDDQARSAVFVHHDASVPTGGGDAVQCLCRRLSKGANREVVHSGRATRGNGELQVSCVITSEPDPNQRPTCTSRASEDEDSAGIMCDCRVWLLYVGVMPPCAAGVLSSCPLSSSLDPCSVVPWDGSAGVPGPVRLLAKNIVYHVEI